MYVLNIHLSSQPEAIAVYCRACRLDCIESTCIMLYVFICTSPKGTVFLLLLLLLKLCLFSSFMYVVMHFHVCLSFLSASFWVGQGHGMLCNRNGDLKEMWTICHARRCWDDWVAST